MVDYDSVDEELETDDESLEALEEKKVPINGDLEEEDPFETSVLPDSELTEELTVRVIPQQPNEFMCTSCFLVRHKGQLADVERKICQECI